VTYLFRREHDTERKGMRSSMSRYLAILIFWLCPLNQATSDVVPSSPMLRQPIASAGSDLAKGKLLVASRRLTDPSFAETVILLLEYSTDGAMGVVLNRSTDISLATVLPEIKALKKRKDVVSLGGPVGREQILLLAHSPKQPERAQKIFDNCYIIVSHTALLHLIGNGAPHIQLRAFAGYAGWTAGQLDAEVSRNDWRLVPAETATVFDTPPEKMWKELIHHSEFEWAGAGKPSYREGSIILESVSNQ
jgi:putative transcriptional regulator